MYINIYFESFTSGVSHNFNVEPYFRIAEGRRKSLQDCGLVGKHSPGRHHLAFIDWRNVGLYSISCHIIASTCRGTLYVHFEGELTPAVAKLIGNSDTAIAWS